MTKCRLTITLIRLLAVC